MTARSMTDAQLAAALRAHLGAMPAQLPTLVAQSTRTTRQQRALPRFLGRLGDVDPGIRSRLLIAAALVALALAFSVAALIGALLQQRDADEVLLPPADVDAFMATSYASLRGLPALQLVLESESGVDTYVWNGADALRIDHGSGDIGTWITNRDGVVFHDRSIDAWVRGGDGGNALASVALILGMDAPECPAGWRHVDVDRVIDRPVHHVACRIELEDGSVQERHLWVDPQLGLALRTEHHIEAPARSTTEITGIAAVRTLTVGAQPNELFAYEGPTISEAQHACLVGLPWCDEDAAAASPTPQATLGPAATPLVTPAPALDADDPPADLAAFVATVHAHVAAIGAIDIVLDPSVTYEVGITVRWAADGQGNWRVEEDTAPDDELPPITYLSAAGHLYESFPQGDGSVLWLDHGPDEFGQAAGPVLGLPTQCANWVHVGIDLVLGRPADHLRCGFMDYWIDREWLLCVRVESHDPLLTIPPQDRVMQVLDVRFGPPPAELFEPPPPEAIVDRPPH